ncbi:response regulator [Methylocella silvestris]|uniref:Regulatory protein VirG n=1 Tax=Methylocella silvestris TaxID=199596 RepID=A0A2J7TKU8_METSI|nr:response regulator [Methylocella silvestris]PNG27392.1 DNA-binding response regulator [Methylocella silvestris]
MDRLPAIIIVDDEQEIRDMIAEYLGRHGFAPRTAAGGADLDALLAEGPCDLIALDVNMPGEDGFSIARRVRAAGDTPILMVTAASEVIDRVVGLEIGADDYITKPFDLRELRARIRSILRRAASSAPEPSPEPDRFVQFGVWTLDLLARKLTHEDGTPAGLTAMEFDLLRAFATNPNRVLSRDRLLDLAHNRNYEAFDRSIDIRVTRLRRKIEVDPAKPSIIKTVHGVGYIFVRGRT